MTETIQRTPGLDKLGLARCRVDNKLFSWKRGGACPVCGAKVEEAPTPEPNAKKRTQRAAETTRSATRKPRAKSPAKKSAKPRRSAKK